jgi:hypothetical protein
MKDVPLRFSVSAGILCDVLFNPRFSRHSKCLSNKAVLSRVQNFVIAIGKPIVMGTVESAIGLHRLRDERFDCRSLDDIGLDKDRRTTLFCDHMGRFLGPDHTRASRTRAVTSQTALAIPSSRSRAPGACSVEALQARASAGPGRRSPPAPSRRGLATATA